MSIFSNEVPEWIPPDRGHGSSQQGTIWTDIFGINTGVTVLEPITGTGGTMADVNCNCLTGTPYIDANGNCRCNNAPQSLDAKGNPIDTVKMPAPMPATPMPSLGDSLKLFAQNNPVIALGAAALVVYFLTKGGK